VELEPPTQKDGSRAVLDSTLAAEGASDPLNDSLGSTQVYDALASEDDEAIEQGEASTRISRREASPAPPQPAHPEPRQPEPEPLPMRTVMLDEGMAPPPLPPAPAQHAAPPPMPSPQPSASPPPLPVSTPSAQRLDAPTAGSAWQRPVTAVPVEAKPAQRMNRGVLVAAGLVTIAGVAAVIVLATRGDPSPAPASAPRSTSTSVALADGSGGQPGEQPGEQPSAETAQEQRPTASATASAATSGEPDGALPAYSDDGRDGAKLLSYLGFLVVRSTADADVYVQGVRLGTTNQKLEARCWTRNVRLREKNDGAWLTPGAPVTITCMDTTTVRMDP
jgi:hypothetical protein